MSMPELPDGFWWSVKAVGPNIITVSLENTKSHPMFPSLGGKSVEIADYEQEQSIVELVESAAAEIYNDVRREMHINSIIEEHWPCRPF